jgi:hypothetical protein
MNVYITIKNDRPEIFRAAYNRLVKYTAFLSPSTFKTTLSNMPRKINSSSKPTQIIKIITHIKTCPDVAIKFVGSGWTIKNSTNPNGSPNRAINNCLCNLSKLKPKAAYVKPAIFATIAPEINKGTLTSTNPKASGIPVRGIEILIILIIGIRANAKYREWADSLYLK